MPEIISKAFQFVPSVVKYYRENRRLSCVDFFNYSELIKGGFNLPPFFNSVLLYGNNKAIESITKRKFSLLRDYVEHGVCFYDTPESTMLMGYADRMGIQNIYTFGTHRKALIEEYLQSRGLRKNVIAVGPYIIGASNFHTEQELQAIKQKYGKILLVYPSHSINAVQAEYDEQSLISEIGSHVMDFDSVFICLYWKDILNTGRLQKYRNSGYTIVCNGLGSDPFFLSRQKDIIMLSDMVMTNGLGTHIGYAVSLGKPVYFFHQNKQISDENGNLISVNKNYEHVEEHFKKVFSRYSFDITYEQQCLVEKYWGSPVDRC